MSIQQSKAAEFHNQTLGNSLTKNPKQNQQQQQQNNNNNNNNENIYIL